MPSSLLRNITNLDGEDWTSQLMPTCKSNSLCFSSNRTCTNLRYVSLLKAPAGTYIIQQVFWDVSNPKSATYGMAQHLPLLCHLLTTCSGNYLTMGEITQIVAPSQQTILKVTKWLAEHNVTNIGMLHRQSTNNNQNSLS